MNPVAESLLGTLLIWGLVGAAVVWALARDRRRQPKCPYCCRVLSECPGHEPL